MDTKALQQAREQVAELEKAMFEEIAEKAAMLGFSLVPGEETPAPKQKRKRRSKAEIEAERSTPNG